MKKSITFRYLENGKLNMIKALYGGKRFNIIPVFYSSDINKFVIIEINGRVGLVLNSEYENTTNCDRLNIKISYALLKNKINNEMMIDLLNSYWYGFNNTIEVIKSLRNTDDFEKDIRVEHLMELMISNKSIKIPNKADLLESLDYIEVD